MSERNSQNAERYGGREWTLDIPSVLDELNATRVRSALSRGMVFGLHMVYYGACGPLSVAFQNWKAFRQYVSNAAAGDRFLLWSVADLRRYRKLLAEKRVGRPGTEAELDSRSLNIHTIDSSSI